MTQPLPGDSFNFSLEAVPSYEMERIAQEVMWPLTAHLAFRDWRTVDVPGHTLQFPWESISGGETVDIQLVASCDERPKVDEDGYTNTYPWRDKDLIHTLRLEVAEIKTGPARDMILDGAVPQDSNEHEEATEEDYIDDGEIVMNGLLSSMLASPSEASRLVTKTHVCFEFNSECDHGVEVYQSISLMGGAPLWMGYQEGGDTAEDAVPGVINVYDFDIIERTVLALPTGEMYRGIFNAIRANPRSES